MTPEQHAAALRLAETPLIDRDHGWHMVTVVLLRELATVSNMETVGFATAEPQGEPVAWIRLSDDSIEHSFKPWMADDWVPLYAHPPRRQPLTETQIDALYEACLGPTGFGGHENNTPERVFNVFDFASAIEHAHGITGEKT